MINGLEIYLISKRHLLQTRAIGTPLILIMLEECESEQKGTTQNPILVPDDNEEHEEYRKKLEVSRRTSLLDEARMINTSFALCCAVVKICKKMHGLSLKERDRVLTKAINDYFVEKVGIKVSLQHFDPKPEADYSDEDTKPTPCEFILYGVDFLNTNAIKEYFLTPDSRVKKITWINDSSCKITFGTPEQARAALEAKFK